MKLVTNLKDLIVVILTLGVVSLLGVVIIGDYYVAVKEGRGIEK